MEDKFSDGCLVFLAQIFTHEQHVTLAIVFKNKKSLCFLDSFSFFVVTVTTTNAIVHCPVMIQRIDAEYV